VGIGNCAICSTEIAISASFIDTGPTDSKEPWKPRSVRWVPADEDVHGWTPFEIAHPVCWASVHGVHALVNLVDESHRFMRQVLDR
jgi:hypothetical protein